MDPDFTYIPPTEDFCFSFFFLFKQPIGPASQPTEDMQLKDIGHYPLGPCSDNYLAY